ncbi:bifunctional helix-turn-helix transcriptional regulator/GNAT family N-acetyltransferase [Acidisphaera sp. S103]|uniref:bifunctional helix-turn-helix transcriptional regulator/GNAT family N-acetyltransferase n=1 Tax=Acidisphaera sp. S103 TaxID=1747223 RepID=UPI00131D914C|nr:bifunctional helix-turn-helix transcriptional regulator/GNAT family N-acetyltransferase [Acidisphaera sp. S103]
MTDTPIPNRDGAVAAVRRFNRFYTRQIGLLDEKLLKSDFTLTEARVLYDLAHQSAPQTLTHLARDLLIDLGYLSRILKAFDTRGLIERSAAPGDGRQALFALTDAGRAAFAPLDRASQREIGDVIASLTPADTDRIVRSMQTIERLLGASKPSAAAVTLRPHRLGDLGWIAHRQAILYAEEYGWDETYEALSAEILIGFVRAHDPRRERGWIAEREGETIGSVFLMRGSDTVGKLRLLYVEPSARGLGVGRQLVDACIGFARRAGYRTLTLWTNDVLVPARRIYAAAGFTCVAAEPHHSFGKDLVGETWELAL